MTRKRSSPMGLDIYLPILLAFIMLPLLSQAAPLQDYTEIQQYTEGCYYNYNHYNEGDRIMTNEPCLNCTCHNKMLMCYLRVCPFTKPIGNDCIVEKREDQCCPIITCPEVPVDVAHVAPEPGTDLSFPEKFGCSIDGKFYLEGAQVPSNPNKPCELCYCIKNRTSCLMQECTLHIDGCTPIYNKGSCCPVRYNCDHENDVLELEDHSTTTEAATTTTTVRPTTGFILTSTMTPAVSTVCVHNDVVYDDGARIAGETACQNCYCMRGDIICAVQECHMPLLNDNGKLCHPLPAAEGECCPTNYACEDDTATTEIIEATTLPSYNLADEEIKISTAVPVKDLHSAIPEEDLQLQTHIDEEEMATKAPAAEGAIEEMVTEAAIVSKPTATKDHNKTDIEQGTTEYPHKSDAEQDNEDVAEESTTKHEDLSEKTTISPDDVKFAEREEFSTAAPTASSDKLFESSTEILGGANDEDRTETIDVEESAEEENESITKVPSAADELPEASTKTADNGDEYTTAVTSASDKPEIEEYATKDSVPSVESQSTTILTPTEEEVSEEITESTHEITKATGADYTTHIPSVSEEADLSEDNDEENKPLEHEQVEPATESPLNVQNNDQSAEKEQSTTIYSLGLTTEAPVKSSEDEEIIAGQESDDVATETPIANEEEVSSKPKEQEVATAEVAVGSTTPAPGKDISEEYLPTEEPKEEEKLEDVTKEEQEDITTPPTSSVDHEQVTDSNDGNVALYSTETSSESEEGEISTQLPLSDDKKKTFATSVPKIEEEIESTTTISIDSMTSKNDIESSLEEVAKIKPIPDEQQEIVTSSGAPTKSDDQTTHPSAEVKPLFEDESGSGDYSTETSPADAFEISTGDPTIEAITSISQKHEEDTATPEPILPTKATPEKETTPSELLEESAESEEDNKLMDLTTAKPLESDITALDTGSSEKVPEEDEEETVTKTSSDAKLMTPDQTEIYGTTTETSLDKEHPTEAIVEHTDKPFEEADISSTPSTDDESSSEKEEKQGTTEHSAELEHVTSQETVGEQEHETSATPAFTDGGQDVQKLLPESDDHQIEEQTVITDSPMLIIEDISAFTTTKPTAQLDIRDEDKDKPEEEQTGQSSSSEEHSPDVLVATSTTKPFVEPSRAEEAPDMLLPSSVPGEGDCLVEQNTYKNNTIVPTSDECELSCKCVSSIVICERVKCEVPENIEKCILDEASSNKCCPTYICNAVALPAENDVSGTESIEKDEDEDEKVQYTTTSMPSAISTEQISALPDANKSNVTTTKPAYAGVSIPEIEMPVAITEEPMSHVKDEDELDLQTTKSPIRTIAEEKKDVLPHDIADEIVVPQSVTPIEILKKDQEIVTEKISLVTTPEKESIPEVFVTQEQPENELTEHTTFAHILGESATDSTIKVATGKQEDEIDTTTITSIAVKPIEKETEDERQELETQTARPTSLGAESSEEPEGIAFGTSAEQVNEPETQTDKKISDETTDEQTEVSTQTSRPTSLSAESPDKSSEEPEITAFDTQTEGTKKPEIQTDKNISHESTEEPDVQTIQPLVDEISPEITTSEEPQNGIENTSAASGSDINISSVTTEFEETQSSTEAYSNDISNSSPTTESNQYHEKEAGIAHTTGLPSSDDFENEYSTTKQSPDDIEALNKKLETVSTADASVTEQSYEDSSTVGDIDHVPAEEEQKDDNDIVKPTEEEDSEEISTEISQTDNEAAVEPVTIAEDKTLEHTVSPIIIGKDKETTELDQPETQTNVAFVEDHTVVKSSQEFDENNKEKDSHTTSVPLFDEKISVHTENPDVATGKPQDFETKTDTHSSLAPSYVLPTEIPSHDIIEDTPTTIDYNIEKHDEDNESEKEQAIDSSTDASIEQQTQSIKEDESEEITESGGDSIEKATESTNEENVTIISAEHDTDGVEISMAQTEGPSDLLTTQKGTDESTIGPIFSSEYTTAAVLSEEDETISESDLNESKKSSTAAPSMGTEIPYDNAPAKKPSVDLFEEASGESIESEEEISTTPSPISQSAESTTQHLEEHEKEGSGEEAEELDEMDTTTQHHSGMSVTTEHAVVYNKHEFNEVSTDKIFVDDTTTIADNASDTKEIFSSEDSFAQTTEKETIPTVTTTAVVEQNTELEPQQHIISSADEAEFNVTTEHPEEEVLVATQIIKLSEGVSDEKTENAIVEYVTKASTTERYEHDGTTIPTVSEDVTDKNPISIGDFESVTVGQDDNKIDETAYTTDQPEDEDVQFSTVKTHLPSHEILHVTTKYPAEFESSESVTVKHSKDDDIFASTTLPIPSVYVASAEQDSDEKEEQEDIGATTVKFETNEIVDLTTSHSPTDELGHTKIKDSEEDIEISTAKQSEELDMTTPQPSKEAEDSLEMETTTVKSSASSDETVDTAVTQLPVNQLKKGNEVVDKTEDHTTQAPMILQHDDSQYVIESPAGEPQYEKESDENITETPATDDLLIVKEPGAMDQDSVLPTTGAESEKDKSQDVTTSIPLAAEGSTDKLFEQVTELSTKGIKSDEEYLSETTELSVSTHVSTEHLSEVSENVTELPTEKFEIEKEDEATHEISTEIPTGLHGKLPESSELPAFSEVSTPMTQEQDSEVPSETAHPEVEQSDDQTTELPADVHVDTDNLTEHSTEKSTELPITADMSTEQLLAHVTEPPKEYHDEDAESHMITSEVSEKIPEHITDIPNKNVETEIDAHQSTDELPGHMTESPYKDVESEEALYEESTDKLSELPSKNAEPEEGLEISTELPVQQHELSTSGQAIEQTTENVSYAEETSQSNSTEVIDDISAVKLHFATTQHPLFSHHTTLPSVPMDSRIDDSSSQRPPLPARNEETFTKPTTTMVSTSTSESITTSAPHYQPQPPVYGQPPQYGPTQYEDEYTDEDEGEVFGPGTCRYGGKLYVSAQQIPRDDPCDFCFCFRSDIICLQQSCPPPIAGCHEEPISGFCCPRYECPVSMATVLNITTSTTTTSTTLPPHFLHHSYGNNVQRNGCLINGRSYRVGEKIESTSGPCINCTCGGDGNMKCDPQACVPEPTMQQVMAVVAAGRKR